MFVCCDCCVLSGRGLCDELITRPEESYRMWCVVVCDLETSRMRRPWFALGRSATEKKAFSYCCLLQPCIIAESCTSQHRYEAVLIADIRNLSASGLNPKKATVFKIATIIYIHKSLNRTVWRNGIEILFLWNICFHFLHKHKLPLNPLFVFFVSVSNVAPRILA